MNKYRRLVIPTLLLISLFSAVAVAQQSDPSTLTLDRIFNSREFTAERFGPARWHGEGGYTTLEPSAGASGSRSDARDIIRYDAATGKRSVLIASTQLIPKSESKPLPIDDYIWSPDGNRLLIYTNSQKVWRLNTRGDYWVLDRKSGKLSKFGGDAKPSTLMFAQFSPDGSKLAYVRESNIYVENVDDHKITQITKDGTPKLINGTFDWVYEEEFGLHDGFRWSPDGKHIAYWQIDASGIPDYYLINDTESLYPKLTPIPYPKAGQTNPAAKVGVVAADGGNTVWLRVSGDERNQYIPSMDWAGNSDEVMIQVMNRLQNNDQVMLGDIRTGDVRTVLTEKDDAWVDVRREDLRWINNGSQFTWLSERDGWRHMYVVSRDGKSTKLVTKFDFDVIDVENVDEKGGWVYFSASPDNATETYLYRTKLDGSFLLFDNWTAFINRGTCSLLS